MENKKINIGCVGMTHLGLLHAVAFAEKGFNLVCYDEQSILIQQLQHQELPVNEPGLDVLVKKNHARLLFTDDIQKLQTCSVVFIAYDVPTDDMGNSNLDVIHRLLEKVQPVLSPTCTLILLSQVPPGFTRQIKFPKTRLFYQVETLIFGKAMERALYPERYIIGANDPEKALPDHYAFLLDSFKCPILKMKYESAELAKISINMFLVASVTTTNTLAEICENIGADWEDIAPSLKLDKRIGPHAYLKPGLGIAGGNLERDLNTIIKISKQHQTDTGVVQAWLHNSQYRRDWVLRCLKKYVFNRLDNPKICILGLAYKPNTHSLKNSPSIALIKHLKKYEIHVHDPIVKDSELIDVIQHTELLNAIEQADVVILMLSSAEYQTLSLEQIAKTMRGNTIIDPYRVLDAKGNSQGIHYFTLGHNSIHIKEQDVEYA